MQGNDTAQRPRPIHRLLVAAALAWLGAAVMAQQVAASVTPQEEIDRGVRALVDEVRNGEEGFGLIHTVRGIGPEARAAAVPVLIEMLDDPDLRVRARAASALSWIGSGIKAAIPALIGMIGIPDRKLQDGVAIALGRMGPDAAPILPTLVERFTDRNEMIGRTAAWVLWRLGPDARAVLPDLIRMLSHSNPRVREQAVYVVTSVAPAERAGPLIIGMTRDRESGVRSQAMAILDRIKPHTDEVIAALEAGLRDGDPDVRRNAAQSLGSIGPRAAAAVPSLIAALDDADAHVRTRAITALRKIRNE